jgi:hypothetical protein
MSQRGSNGMMAHVGKPGNLTDALDRVMLQTDPASPIPETPSELQDPITETTVERSPEPTAKPIARRTKAEKSNTGGGILGELTAHQKRPRVKVTLNTRIDDWVDAAINRTLRRLEEEGFTNVTKEAIVTQSLIRGLNLTPPEGWELL